MCSTHEYTTISSQHIATHVYIESDYTNETTMGVGMSSTKNVDCALSNDNVNFEHFQILRAIGRGSFGKVCIVQKRDSGRRFAMKYVSRSACSTPDALCGVLREVELLSSMEHPFLVNLWFSFQDEEDLFMVSDLLAGGDLRYHLQKETVFGEESVCLLICELGLALEYLQQQHVLHRDIKPDNILLDERGHAHLTDFNIATRLPPNGMACSMSGTKPYMAPEVFMCALDEIAGYSYAVDWWSLGVVAYEMRAGVRPFVVHATAPLDIVKSILIARPHYPRAWSAEFTDLVRRLLNIHPAARISSLRELQQTSICRHRSMKQIMQKETVPAFKPPAEHLNCDPALELEEMIVEAKPLHKKKKRLAKQRSAHSECSDISTPIESQLVKEFPVYNRFKELERRSLAHKDADSQTELPHSDAVLPSSASLMTLSSLSGDTLTSRIAVVEMTAATALTADEQAVR